MYQFDYDADMAGTDTGVADAKIDVARYIHARGMCFSFEVRQGVHQRRTDEIDRALDELELEGALDRYGCGRLVVVRDCAGTTLEAPHAREIEALEIVEACDGDAIEKDVIDKAGREAVEACIAMKWLLPRVYPGLPHRMVRITPQGRAITFRQWRKRSK